MSERLIPAHAGKTGTQRGPRFPGEAHPRSRGENASSMPSALEMPGSSPLTRGKLPRQLVQIIAQGLIPAHAGKTITPAGVTTVSAAHPRSRGENVRMVSPPQALMGSSPLTRGKHHSADWTIDRDLGSSPLTRGKQREGLDSVLPGRLIPAHAGKTFRVRTQRCNVRAHPRSRGENWYS